MKGQVILLHGPSSVGKTTLAHVLQEKLNQPYWHISIDHLRDGGIIPMHRYQSGEFNWRQDRRQIFTAFHATLVSCANSGVNTIAEHIIDTAGWIDELVELFQDIDVYFVGMSCNLETLVQREHARADRPIGSAQQDFANVHKNRKYDLELDGTDRPNTNADAIIKGLRSGLRCSEFS
ncbi:MAG: AAA family ATPase [Paracoccaceae bacterium]